jgi:hypothetical protein
MALAEKDLEKKSLADIEGMIFSYEQRSKDLAAKVGSGQAKTSDMISVNSDLALLRKLRDKKMLKEGTRLGPRTQQKSSAPLKSYEDFLNTHNKKH